MESENNVSRRGFLKTGLGTMAVAVAGCSSQQVGPAGPAPIQIPPGQTIRCGMIGTGGRGRGVLSQLVQAAGGRVTALCDIDKESLAKAAEIAKDHKPTLFDDYHKMLEYKELDAVFVHTPCHLHARMFIDVLQSGRHLYGEKPMALTVAECDAIVAAAKASGKVFQGGTQLRYASPWQPAVRAVQQGRIGRPIAVRAHRNNSGDLPHDRIWFHLVSMSGDTIIEQAVHELDLINWALGRLPIRAAGFGGQSYHFQPPGRNIMDHYGVTFDYGNDLIVTYSHSWIGTRNVPYDGWRILVYGADGSVDMTFSEGKIYLKPDGKAVDVDPEPKGNWDLLAINDFFRCIREGAQPLATVEAGREAVLTALLGRKAIYEKRVVTMGEILVEKAV